MQPKVTVIVPVYNVAAYIEKCAVSIFEQTLDSLEILFIDDCSPDNSIDIIKDVLKKYPCRVPQTKIYRMLSNSGSARVREKGIREAQGQYVIHCDSDDWLDSDLYENLYNKAIETAADVVVCDEAWEYKNKSVFHVERELPDNGKEVVQRLYKEALGMFCHNKLVKRSVYVEHEIYPWPGLNMWEDNGLFTRIFYYSDTLSQIHGSYYHYNKTNVNAMTVGYGIDQVEQMIEIADNLTKFFQSKPDAEDFGKTIMAFQFLAKINLVTDSYKNLRRYRSVFPNSEQIISELDTKFFSAKGLLRFRLVKCHLGCVFVLMFKIMKWIGRL